MEARHDYLGRHIGDADALQTVTEWLDELEQQRDFQRRLIEELPQLLFVVDRCGQIVQFNRACELLTGYTATEMLQRHPWEMLLTHDMRQYARALFDDLQPHSIPAEVDTAWLTKTGHPRPIHWTNTLLFGDHGVVEFIVSVGKEVTEEGKTTQQHLAMLLERARQTEKLYSLIAENVTDIILIVAPDLSLSYISPACFTLLGYQPEDILSIDPYTLIHPDDETATRTLLTGLSKDNLTVVVENRVRHKSGKYVWLETNLRVILNPDGNVHEIIGIARNISERREYENALALSNRELEAFTSSVSHDLRAPLRAIEGFSRMLLEGYAAQLTSDTQRYVSLIQENALQMGKLLNDLLTFSRLSRQPVMRRQVDMTTLVLQTFAEIDLNQRVIDFTVDNLPPAEADFTLLHVVVDNLLRNAVKFTAKRQVAVIEVGWDEQDGEVIYWVKDNGVGFNMKYAYKLFKVFQRLHRPEDYEGTGIGLATVERIVQRHGGRVWAQSETDKGATFYFTLRGK